MTRLTLCIEGTATFMVAVIVPQHGGMVQDPRMTLLGRLSYIRPARAAREPILPYLRSFRIHHTRPARSTWLRTIQSTLGAWLRVVLVWVGEMCQKRLFCTLQNVCRRNQRWHHAA